VELPEAKDPVLARVEQLRREFADQVVVLSPEERALRKVTDSSPLQWAYEQVAKERGLEPDSIRRRCKRARYQAGQRQKQQAAFADRHRWQFESYGLDIDAAWLDAVVELQDHLHMALFGMRSVGQALKALVESEWYPNNVELKLARERYRQLASDLKGLAPAGICPWCKQTEGVIEQCAPCHGLGLILECQVPGVPASLLSADLPLVLHQGAEKPLCAFVTEPNQEELFE